MCIRIYILTHAYFYMCMHLQAVDDYYEKIEAEKGPDGPFLFSEHSEKLLLDISMNEHVEHNGWNIYPLVAPVVSDIYTPRYVKKNCLHSG